jgi:hypothetical protein
LGSAEEIQQKLAFPIGGPDQASGVIVMALNDSGSAADGTDVDPALSGIVVIFNARRPIRWFRWRPPEI